MDLICANCSQPNPPGAKLCARCSSVFPVVASETLLAPSEPAFVAPSSTMVDATAGTGTMVDVAAGSGTVIVPSDGGADANPARNMARVPSTEGGQRARADSSAFAAGTVDAGARLGSRYEIVRLLGKGGMGAVYLARDLDLGRDVALKLIAPHLANERAVLERFKREIQLSSIVTHANVLRVYDLGEADGVKFLTMQFIEGETLADLLARERPLPVERLLPIFRQICDGLAAAHEKAVLHRDLKPQNVMLDAAGHVYLMDFGLATSRTMTAMTQAGAVMGTPQYMSPEQVKGTATDARTDIFSLGVMLYEMLAGELPFTGDSLFEIMVKRTLAPPRPIVEVNPSVPPYLQQMVERCLAVDPALRYGTMAELLADLDAGTVKAPIKKKRGPSRTALLLSGALVAVLGVGIGGTILATKLTKPAGPPKPVTLLVADFDNRTGEAVFNGTLEPAMTLALEGASFITGYSRADAQKIADELKFDGTGLTEKRARLVAQREGVAIVTTGFIERDGAGYRVGVRSVDAFTGQRVYEATQEVGDRERVLAAATKLAAGLRTRLGDVTPEGIQIKEGETFGAASLEAAHEYSLGMVLQLAGKTRDATRHYLEALKLDPDLGRAYAGLAVMALNDMRRGEAENYFQEAMARVHRMSAREKYRTIGVYYTYTRDLDKALDALTVLVKQYPSDTAGLFNLATVYGLKRDFPRSLAVLRQATAIYPNDILARHNMGLSLLYVGDFEAAIGEEQKAAEMSPTYISSYIGLALAQEAAGRTDAAVATWEKARRVNARGESVAAEGLADLALLEGRVSDARGWLEKGVQADLAAHDQDGAGRKLVVLAQIAAAGKQWRNAVMAAERAVKFSSAPHVILVAGAVLAQAGQEARAAALANDLERQLGSESRAYAAMVRGAIELRRRNVGEAIRHLQSAVQLLDGWAARFALGRAYLETEAFSAASDEMERCVKRKGEGADVYADEVPTYRHFAEAQYYLARAQEGLKNPGAAPAYRAFLELKKSDEDPLVKDARARLAALEAASPKSAVVPAAK